MNRPVSLCRSVLILLVAMTISQPSLSCSSCRYYVRTETTLNAVQCHSSGTYIVDIWAHDCGCSVTGLHGENSRCVCNPGFQGSTCEVNNCGGTPNAPPDVRTTLTFGLDGFTGNPSLNAVLRSDFALNTQAISTSTRSIQRLYTSIDQSNFVGNSFGVEEIVDIVNIVTTRGLPWKALLFATFLLKHSSTTSPIRSTLTATSVTQVDRVELAKHTVSGAIASWLTTAFVNDVNTLGRSTVELAAFQAKYGTHVVIEMRTGGFAVSQVSGCTVTTGGFFQQSTTSSVSVIGGLGSTVCYGVSADLWVATVKNNLQPVGWRTQLLSNVMLTLNATSGAAYASYLKDYAINSNPELLSTELSTQACPPPPAPPAQTTCFRAEDVATIPCPAAVAGAGVQTVSVASLAVGSQVFTRNGQLTTVIAKHVHRGAHRYYRFQSCPASPNVSTCVGYAVTHGHLIDVSLHGGDSHSSSTSALMTVPDALSAWRSGKAMFLTDDVGRAVPLTSVEETVEDVDSVFLLTSSLDIVVNGIVASCRSERDVFMAPLLVAMSSFGLSPQRIVEARFRYLPESYACPNPFCLAFWGDTLILTVGTVSLFVAVAVSSRRSLCAALVPSAT